MSITAQLTFTPEQIAALRVELALSPAEIDAIAHAVVAQLRRESIQASATMTIKEFAVQARITPTHVHRLIRQGKLEATRPGGGDRRITAAAAAKFFAGGNGHAAE